MLRNLILTCPLLFLGAVAAAQTPPLSPAVAPTPAAPAVMIKVKLLTSEGAITLALNKTHAPITTTNFLRYVDQKKLNGTTIYRALKMATGDGLIQGGTLGDPRHSFPPIAHEPTTQTGLSHLDGTISMARGDPGTARGDFFIIVGDLSGLDANPKQTGDNAGYAAFGHVIEGMDVVHHILDAPKSATKGEGVMKGQMIEAPVKIISAQRLP